jgi:uncharacterized repeat protein (TIGR02543 family)
MRSRKPHGIISVSLIKRFSRLMLLPLLAFGLSLPTFAPLQAAGSAPTITNLTSNSNTYSSGVLGGPFAGGTTVTITGTNMTGISGVTVGGVAATSVTFVSDTSATFVTPAGDTNTAKDVVVTTNIGSVTRASAFTYLSAIPCGTSGNFYVGANRVTHSVSCVGTVVVPEGVTSIETGAFCDNPSCIRTGSALGAVTLPSTLVTLGSFAFMSSNAASVSFTLPSSLTTIGSQAFSYTNITSVVIPKSVTRLAGAPFYKAYLLSSVTFEEPSSLTSIGTEPGPNGLGPFYYTRVYSMSLPSSITTIGSYFKDTPLQTLTLNSNVTSIAAGALPATSPPYANIADYTPAPSGLKVIVNKTNGSYVNNYTYTSPAPVVVTSPDSVTAASTITSLSVTSGFTEGGTSVRLRGTNLSGVNKVWVRGVLATNVVVESSTSLTFTTSAANAGTTDVWINGTSGPTIGTGLFTYVSSIVTSVTPSSGLATGGTSITIKGENFSSVTGLTFSGTAAASYTVVDSSTITATTPAVVAGGTYYVRVVRASGTSQDLTAARFTYIGTSAKLSALTISSGTLTPTFATGTNSYTASVISSVTSISVRPTLAAAAAGAAIKVNGTSVNSGALTTVSGLVDGDNTINVVVTAQDAVTVETYTVVINKASAISNDANLSALSLSSGSLSPTFAGSTTNYTASVANAVTSITVTPTVNQASAVVRVNGTTVTSASASGSISLSVGSNTITVLNTAQDGTTTKTYTVTVTRAPPAPTITSFDNSTPNYGATVRVTGTDFTAATSVKIGSASVATFSVESATSLTFVVNARCCTAETVSVTTSGGTGTSIATITPQPQLPIITTQPQATTTSVGQSVTLTVAAAAPSDTGTVTYQWRKGSNAITGATSATYTFTPASVGDAGDYSAVVYNTLNGSSSSTNSNTAALTVNVVNRYSVTYNGNLNSGGSVPSDTATYLSGDTVNVLGSGTLSRTGYTFNGWTTDSSNTNSLLTNSSTVTVSTANITLYAAWTANQYVVTYDANGGTVNVSSDTFTTGTTPLILPTPTRTSFTFTGWYTLTSNGTLVGLAGANYSPIESSTVHAQWVQNSLAGLPAGSLTLINTYQVSPLITVSSTFSTAGSTVNLTVPAGALPSGTSITYWLLNDAAEQAAPLPGRYSHVLSMVISWLNSDGTVPDAASGKPLVMTITNSAIKAGTNVYSVVGSSVTLLGTATQDGQVSVDLTSDPQIYVVQRIQDAPSSSVTVSTPNPVQTVNVTSKVIETGPTSGGNVLKLEGNFAITGSCRISQITVADVPLSLSDWSLLPNELSITMPPNDFGITTIQIYNNCSPMISPIVYLYANPDPVIANPVPAPVELPAKNPNPVVNIQPSASLKKVATFFFANGVTNLNKAQISELTKLARIINASPSKKVFIYGFADLMPSPMNSAVSKKRASKAEALLSRLVKGKTLQIGWYGSSKPLVPGNSPQDNAKNRRVEIWTK